VDRVGRGLALEDASCQFLGRSSVSFADLLDAGRECVYRPADYGEVFQHSIEDSPFFLADRQET